MVPPEADSSKYFDPELMVHLVPKNRPVCFIIKNLQIFTGIMNTIRCSGQIMRIWFNRFVWTHLTAWDAFAAECYIYHKLQIRQVSDNKLPDEATHPHLPVKQHSYCSWWWMWGWQHRLPRRLWLSSSNQVSRATVIGPSGAVQTVSDSRRPLF